MINKYKKLIDYFSCLVLILALLYLGLILLGNVFFQASMNWSDVSVTYFNSFFCPVTLIAIIVSLVLLFGKLNVIKRLSGKSLLKVSILVTIVVSFYFIFSFNSNLSVDAEDIMNVALYWKETGMPKIDYLSLLPYQFGVTNFLYLLLVVFKTEANAILVFRIINVLALVSIDVVIFLFIRRLINEKYAGYGVLLLSLLIFPQALTCYVYGDLIGYVLAFISLYLCVANIEEFKINRLIVQSVLLLFAIYFRLPTIIIGITEVLVVIMYYKHNKILVLLGLLSVIILGNKSGELILNHIYEIKTANIPMVTRFVMSFDINYSGAREPGWFTGYAYSLHNQCHGDAKMMSKESLIYLNEIVDVFIKNPPYAINFLGRKFYSQWLIPDFETFSILKIDNFTQHQLFGIGSMLSDSYFIYFSTLFMKTVFLPVLVYAFVGILFGFKDKKGVLMALLISIVGCGSYHFIAEVKARYVIPYATLFIPISVYGIYKLRSSTYLSKINGVKSHIIGMCSLLCFFSIFYDYMRIDLPVLEFGAYTDTQDKRSLKNGYYYQIPINTLETYQLTDVSLLLSSEVYLSGRYLQLDLLNEISEPIASNAVLVDTVGDNIWVNIDLDVLLEKGKQYTLQISSNSDDDSLKIVLGEQYGYINQEYLNLNGFQTTLKANYKLYRNHY